VAVRKASDSNLTGKKYNDGSAGGAKVPDVVDPVTPGEPSVLNSSASIPFTASSKGGVASSFVATSNPGSITGSGSSSPITVDGLEDNTTYTFTIAGVNATATGPSSGPTSSVTVPNYPLNETDDFNRTTTNDNNLGTASGPGSSVWQNLRGVWTANGTVATSASAANNNNIATVYTKGTNVTNLQVDTLGTGGVGVAFWATDANSWYAATVFHSTTSGSETTCTGGCTQTGGYCGSCCANQHTYQTYHGTQHCCDGYNLGYSNNSGGCDYHYAFYCQVSSRGNCGCSGSWAFYYACTANTTTNYTNYISNFKLLKNGTALVNNQYDSNRSGYSSAGSIAISTSGDTISYAAYSAANKGGSVRTSGTYTDSGATKSRHMGIFKGEGGTNQGSNVDNFSVTVTT
jgi:hypothetical protein